MVKILAKRCISTVVAAAMLAVLLPIMSASAETSGECGDDLTWTLDDEGTLTISGTGDMWDTEPWYDNRLDIKSVVIGNSVTSIGNKAFYYCNNLASIDIPDSVKRIGEDAFSYCENLKSVTIPYGVTDIENNTFYGCDTLESVYIPDGVTSIGDYVFYRCYALNNIDIPKGVTSIGNSAFDHCSDLESITIPDSLISMGRSAFAYCDKLISIDIPKNVASIGGGAFYTCGKLECINVDGENTNYKSVDGVLYSKDETILYIYPEGKTQTSCTVPSGVTSIASESFGYNKNLKSVVIPDSVTSIGEYAFCDCYELTDVYYTGTEEQWDSIEIAKKNDRIQAITKHYNYKEKIDGGNCGENVAWTLYDNDTLVISGTGYMTDYYTDEPAWNTYKDNIKSVVIEDGVTSIGYRAFIGCDKLTDISIPSSMERIEGYSFSGCSALESITIPDSVTNIGERAFVGCTDLAEINVEDGNLNYTSADGVLYTADMQVLYTYPAKKSGTEYKIPDNVITIDKAAFAYCHNLESVSVPDGLVNICDWAFYDCSNLTSVNIPDTVDVIDDMAFYNCGFESIKIPDSVTKIGDGAFDGCSDLTDVYYTGTKDGWSNIVIGNNNTNLTEANIHYNYRDVAVAQSGTFGDGFTWKLDVEGTLTISGTGDMPNWSYTTPWYNYCSDVTAIVIEDGVTSIGRRAFEYCKNVTRVIVPENITSIGEYAFSDCTGLNYIYIPKSVTSISAGVFDGSTALQDIAVEEENPNYKSGNGVLYSKDGTLLHTYPAGKTETTYDIPSGVTSIGDYAFAYSGNLTSVNILDGVTSIGKRAFDNCGKLKGITIPNGVTSMGSYMFYNCKKLSSITIPDSVTTMEEWMFYNCTSLTSVTLPKNITTVSKSMFYDCSGLKSVSIPSGVTSIEGYAFFECGKLETITDLNGVISIGGSAFAKCSALKTITVSDKLTSIEQSAFGACKVLSDVYYSGTEEQWGKITIGNNNDGLANAAIHCGEDGAVAAAIRGTCGDLTWTIDNEGTLTISGTGDMPNWSTTNEQAWYTYQDNIKSVVIEDGVTSIGSYAFCYLKNMTGVTIPSSVTQIGELAFTGCTKLASITLPNGITSIEKNLFSGCTGLKSIIIPESVTTIKDSAFYGCTGLTSIIIPKNVSSIENNAFLNCSGLTEINVDEENTNYKSESGVLFNSDKTALYIYPAGKTETTYDIPSGVTSIGKRAFYKCTNLNGVTIPEGVTNIDYCIFEGCTGLVSVIIPRGVTEIGGSAFYGCSALRGVFIPDSVTSIGNGAFYLCGSLTDVYYTGTEEQWETVSIDVSNECLDSVTMHYNASEDEVPSEYPDVTEPEEPSETPDTDEPEEPSETPDTTEPEEPSETPDTAKPTSGNCGDNLTWVLDDNGTLTISGTGDMWDWNTYSGYSDAPWSDSREDIKEVVIGDSVKSIGNGAFEGCTALVSVEMPQEIARIGENAFYDCIGLTAITIPRATQNIGYGAFANCSSLTEITVDAENTNYKSKDGVLMSFGETTLYVYPAGKSGTTYEIPETVNNIENTAFEGCNDLKSIIIPDSVMRMGDWAFAECRSLEDIILSGSMTDIGNGTFFVCGSLKSVTVPNSIRGIGDNAFNGCDSLTDVNYLGTESDWKSVAIGDYNYGLANATIHYTDTAEPEEPSETPDITEPEAPIPDSDMDYTIHDIVLTDNGVSVNISNRVGTGGKLIVAAFAADESGMSLVGIKFKDLDLAENTNGNVEVEVNTDGANYIATFIWNDMVNMIPISRNLSKSV